MQLVEAFLMLPTNPPHPICTLNYNPRVLCGEISSYHHRQPQITPNRKWLYWICIHSICTTSEKRIFLTLMVRCTIYALHSEHHFCTRRRLYMFCRKHFGVNINTCRGESDHSHLTEARALLTGFRFTIRPFTPFMLPSIHLPRPQKQRHDHGKVKCMMPSSCKAPET